MTSKYPFEIYRPDTSSYPKHLQHYISLAKGKDGFEALMLSASAVTNQLSELSEAQLPERYDSNKWSIQELFLHLIDNERIFQNRAFRIARNESKSLSGYDQDRYVNAHPPIIRSKESLLEEYQIVRKSTFLLFASFSPAMMAKEGRIGNTKITLGSIPFIITGHDWHHLSVLRDFYL